MDLGRGVARNLLRGGTKVGLWGTEVQGVQGHSPGGVWVEAPRNRRQMLISSYDGEDMHPCSPLARPLDVENEHGELLVTLRRHYSVCGVHVHEPCRTNKVRPVTDGKEQCRSDLLSPESTSLR